MNSERNRFDELSRPAAIADQRQSRKDDVQYQVDVGAPRKNNQTSLMLPASQDREEPCRLQVDANSETATVDASRRNSSEPVEQIGLAQTANLADCSTAARPNRNIEAMTDETSIAETLAVFESVEPHAVGAFLNWAEDPEPTRPAEATGYIDQIVSSQQSITAYQPYDESQDWSDVEIVLPEANFTRHVDWYSRQQYRDLFAAAWLKGRVAESALFEAAVEESGALDDSTIAHVRVVLNDMGIEIDGDACLAEADTAVEPPEDTDTKAWAEADDAIAFFEQLQSSEFDPLNQYMREMNRWTLLTREDEQQLGQMIENAIHDATRAAAGSSAVVCELATRLDAVIAGISPSSELFEIGPRSVPGIDPAESQEPIPAESTSGSEQDRDDPELLPAPQADELNRLLDLKELLTSTAPRNGLAEMLVDCGLSWSVLAQFGAIARDTGDHVAAEAIRSGLDAALGGRRTIVESNFRLVFSIARHYLASGMPILDLIQEGNIGLMKAATRFDYRKGFKFSTYATWWIRQSTTRAIADKVRAIRIPVHLLESMNKIRKVSDAAAGSTGLRLSAKDLEKITGIPALTIRNALRVPDDPVSIEEFVPDCEPALETFSDELPSIVELISVPSLGPEDCALASGLQETVREALAGLKEQQRVVLRMRFGLDMESEYTLEEVGEEYDLTRERIRQIESKSLKKLSSGAHSLRLRSFLDVEGRREAANELESPVELNGPGQ